MFDNSIDGVDNWLLENSEFLKVSLSASKYFRMLLPDAVQDFFQKKIKFFSEDLECLLWML